MKPIFINSSPNTEFDDVLKAFAEFVRPWRWNSSKLAEGFEKQMENYFSDEIHAVGFDSARSSFYQILKAWGIGKGDEVMVPAFTCTVIVNPILWVGAKPVYVDIDPKTFNMDLSILEKKITSNTKVILAQHTFGLPMDMMRLREMAEGKNIKIVEDCAHSLGQMHKGRLTGTFADAAVITFGISKVISGVRGGMAITADQDLFNKLKTQQSQLPEFPKFHAFKFILNPIIWHLITPIYYLGFRRFTVGRMVVLLLQKLKILSRDNIVEQCEELGLKPDWLPTKMSGSLAQMAAHQLKKIEKINEHRKTLAQIYSKELYTPFYQECLYVRYPLYVEDKNLAIEDFRKKRIILGDWYKSILHIPEKYYSRLLYKKGECPNAEITAKQLVNLPTFIKVLEFDARRISLLAREHKDDSFYEER